MKPVRLGITGIQGYANHIADRVLAGQADGEPLQLVAVTAPDMDQWPERMRALQAQGVEAVPTFDDLLSRDDIDAVWLPLPIDLHAPFTEQALRAGKAVMCEKPVAGTVDEVDRMIRVRDETGVPAAIGFNDIYDPATLAIKRRLRQGAIGAIRRISVLACAPRTQGYFRRAAWAGRIRRDGAWVLDSPAQNATSHFINLALYLAGPSDDRSARPVDVAAELYRVNSIENYDTCTMRYRLDTEGRATLLVCMTHACDNAAEATIVIHGERGRLIWTRTTGGRFLGDDGRERTIRCQDNRMIRRFAQHVRGIDNADVGLATLEVGRCHTIAINGASQAAAVVDVPADEVHTQGEGDGQLRFIPSLAAVLQQCADKDMLLHESGLARWSAPAATLDLRSYNHFAGVPGVPGTPGVRENARR